MPSPTSLTIRHLFEGGWAPDRADVAEVRVIQSGDDFMVVGVPHLAQAHNVFFTLTGGTRKIGGTDRVNAAALEAGASVMGGFDYWKLGTSGSPVQKRIVAVGTKVKKDDADGTFTDIVTGWTAGAVPHFSQFIDVVIMANDNNSDVPWTWDQTTARKMQNDRTIAQTTGTGLSDVTASGDYTGDTNSTFTLEIVTAAIPDTWRWRKDAGAWSAPINMVVTVQSLSDGISATWATTTGHAAGDQWTITTHLVPNFAFSEIHGNRVWAAGNDAAPSTLYYSVAEDHEDFESTGSGTISIDPGDGDRITAIRSTKKDLIIWKGPYKGSMHRLTGTSSSDLANDPFKRETIIRGVGAGWQNSTFAFGNDLGFVALDGSIRSVSSTDQFGDFREGALSVDLNDWLDANLNKNRLRYIQAVPHPKKSGVLFMIPVAGGTSNKQALWMDHRLAKPRWSDQERIAAECAFLVIDASNSNQPTIFIGDTDGFVRRTDRSSRNIDTTGAIQATTKTPYLSYGNPQKFKQISRGSVGLIPKGNYNMTWGWQNDDNPLQTQDVSQEGGDVLGPSSINPFTLDTSVLGSGDYQDVFLSLESGGEFRNIQYTFENGDLNQDIEVHNFSATIRPGADSSEN